MRAGLHILLCMSLRQMLSLTMSPPCFSSSATWCSSFEDGRIIKNPTALCHWFMVGGRNPENFLSNRSIVVIHKPLGSAQSLSWQNDAERRRVTRKTSHVIKGLGFWASLSSMESRGAGAWVQSCDHWVHQSQLHNETAVRTPDTEAWWGFLAGEHMSVLGWWYTVIAQGEGMKALCSRLFQTLPYVCPYLFRPDLNPL